LTKGSEAGDTEGNIREGENSSPEHLHRKTNRSARILESAHFFATYTRRVLVKFEKRNIPQAHPVSGTNIENVELATK